MKITALKQQVKNPERVSIFVDEKYASSLTTSQLIEEKLRVGTEVDDKRLQELKTKSADGKLRVKAMNWVFLRPRSVKELRDYLKRTQYASSKNGAKGSASPEAVDMIIDDFIRRKWVDDEVFARWWIDRSSRASKSLSFLRSELMLKGISRELISEVLRGKDEGTTLKALVEKLSAKPKYQDKAKLLRYLVSKGYSYSSVTEALAVGAEESLD